MILKIINMKYYLVSITFFLTNSVIITDAYRSYGEFYRNVALTKGPTTSVIVNILWEETETKTNNDLVKKDCYNSLDEFRKGVEQSEEWALKMLDSSSHLQSGYLEGNINNYGNYEECMNTDNLNKKIKVHYCESEIQVDIKNDSIENQKYTAIYQKTKMAVCLPVNCTTFEISMMLKNHLSDFVISDCISGRDSAIVTKIRKPQRYIICAIIAIILLVVLATVHDAYIKKTYGGPKIGKVIDVFKSFSLRPNLDSLLKEDKNQKSITCMHGLRFISACGIIIVHRNLTDKQPFTNYFQVDKELTELKHMLIINAYLFVDVFFLMSGLLISYSFLNRKDDKKKFKPLHLLLHRYIRLTPPLAAVIMITIVIGVFCTGYICDTVTAPYLQGSCRRNWYYTLLYINNLLSVGSKCVSHSWYLTADMQLFVFSFILLYIMSRNDSMKYILSILALLIMMNISTIFYLSNKYKLKTTQVAENDMLMRDAEYVYEPFYTRAGPWLIGFGLGILLNNSNKRPVKMNKVLVALGWVISIICILVSSFGIYPFMQYDYVHYQPIEYAYKATYRNVWAGGFAWIIFACYTGYGGIVNNFLSSHAFHPLSKLTYCLYLIHPLVQTLLFGDRMEPRKFSDNSQIIIYVGDVFYSLIAALILHLCVEAPTLRLEKLFMMNKSQQTGNNQSIEIEPDKDNYTHTQKDGSSLNNKASVSPDTHELNDQYLPLCSYGIPISK